MQKNNFQILKGWIASYEDLGQFLLKKEDLQNLVDRYVSYMHGHKSDADNLLRLIELKEMQLMGRPVFDEQGYLLDNHFNPVTYTYFNAMRHANKLREQGYYVKLDGNGHIKIQLLETESQTV